IVLDMCLDFNCVMDVEWELENFQVKNINMTKKFTFPPKEEMERVRKRIARPGYRRVNIGLLPDATESDKAKFYLCKKISPDYEEKNKEFITGLKEKGIKPTKLELAKVLITDDLIRELVKQLASSGEEKRIKNEGNYYQYSYYSVEPIYNQ
ncbi:8959_t:CDS:2, partial [Ambispora gerdemannii]